MMAKINYCNILKSDHLLFSVGGIWIVENFRWKMSVEQVHESGTIISPMTNKIVSIKRNNDDG